MRVSLLWFWLSLGIGSTPPGPVAADAGLAQPDAGASAPVASVPVCEPGDAPFQGRWCVQAEGPFSDVLDVKATAQATCVLRSDSSVWCWGELDSYGDRATAQRPRRASRLDGARSIAMEAWSVCGALDDGSLTCQGDFLTFCRGLESLRARALFASVGQACIVSTDGEVACLRLVGGIPTPVSQPRLRGARSLALSSGSSHGARQDVCGQMPDGKVRCVGDLRAPADARAVALGDRFACFARAKDVFCQGEGVEEDLRLPAPRVAGAPVAVGVGPVEALWSGRTEVCARRVDQTVVCWGGALRDNRTCTRKGCQTRELPTLRGATALGFGGMRVCGVVEGRLECAGWR